MLPQHYHLLDKNGRVVAAGSREAIHAAARLFWGPNVKLENRFENQIFMLMSEAISKDIDREILGEYL